MSISEQYIRSISLKESDNTCEQYPFNLAAVRTLDHLQLDSNVTFIIGENGSGKSTLLEAIAVAYGLNAEGGSKNFNFATRASHSSLHEHIQITRGIKRPKDTYFLRAESFYNVASDINTLDEEPDGSSKIIDGYGGTSLHEQSHGESFFALFNNRLRGNGMYILDEPEAALSPQRQFEFLVRLNELIAQNSQCIIATHSPILLSYPKATIYELNNAGYQKTTYKETEYYKLYEAFLRDPEQMLARLKITI